MSASKTSALWAPGTRKPFTTAIKTWPWSRRLFEPARPVYVRSEPNTRGHVLVVMLAYLIVRELKKAWANFDLTVEECSDQLKTLCAVEMKTAQGGACLRLPAPNEETTGLLQALNVRLPEVLPQVDIKVDTRKKLMGRRINYRK